MSTQQYTAPTPPDWSSPDWRDQVGPWVAELQRLTADPGWNKWYTETYLAPPPPVANSPNAYDRAHQRWDVLLSEHWRLLRKDGCGSSHMPNPLDGDQLRALVVTLLHPRQRGLLRGLLLDLLGDTISDIALAVAQEVCRGQ